MNSANNKTVVSRFFEAIEELRVRKHSIPEICERIDTDKGNFYRKRRGERGNATLPVEWLSALVEKYNVSAEWLLVGKGEMFKK